MDHQRILLCKLANAKFRCGNSKRPAHIEHYQDKGIKVCEEWLSDKYAYLRWALPLYKDGLELDRIDNSKGYSPDNCRFSTAKASRRHRSNCRSFEVLDAVELLRANGFSELFIAEHFPMPS